MNVTSERDTGCDVWGIRAHPVGEIHFHGQDADILRAGIRRVGSDAVGMDTVESRHFRRVKEMNEEGEVWMRGEDEREEKGMWPGFI